MTHDVITPELVALDADLGRSTSDVIAALAALVADAGRADDANQLTADALAREAKSDTGVPGGVAIPHCRSEAVTEPTLAFARLRPSVDFSGPDGAADLVFLIAAPAGGGKAHLKILSKLARALVKPNFTAALRGAATREELVGLVLDVVKGGKGTKEAAATASQPAGAEASAAVPVASTAGAPDAAGDTPRTRIVAITACPTGIAHTYMAADSLTQAAAALDDVDLQVETQGSSAVTPLPEATIAAADAVIFATDVGVKDRERFAGKPVIESGVKRAINEPRVMIEEAKQAASNPSARRVAGTTGVSNDAGNTSAAETGRRLGWGKRIQQAVMTGVSYMIPFVAAGGLLLALGFLIGGTDMAGSYEKIVTEYSLTHLPQDLGLQRAGLPLYLGAVLFAIGKAAMGFIVPALSGYIAYALGGRPGIAPGFVGGAISVTLGAGFIGGLVTGILAGLLVAWINSWRVPRILASLMPVVIIPFFASLLVGLAMFLLLGHPLAAIMTGLQHWLSSMSGSSAVLLGIILGLMMCFDLGGPVNKAAYLFATAGLSTGDEASMKIMAAVMGAGMVPPIALSIATMLRGKLFTPAELENGKSAWLLGLTFISEGAIPFAAADPLRVIPAMMAGGATTGALSMLLGAGSQAPHGGLFVILAIHPAWAWLAAIAAGCVVSTIAVIGLKQLGARRLR